ncbi:MAG: hypothetical protein JNJ46_33680 [Myxococcales bacterium]|nr:hypothetical protein [Myxococcales bacterium]
MNHPLQDATRIANSLKQFAYQWYCKFDRGTDVDALLPYLPEGELEFVYPQATLKTLPELLTYARASFRAIQRSAHCLHELFVFPIGQPGTYELLCPHEYQAQLENGDYVTMQFIGRMHVRLGEGNSHDPSGRLPKIHGYKVLMTQPPTPSSADRIDHERHGKFLINEAKAFVHEWFKFIDLGDADALMSMVSEGPLNINILGTSIDNAAALKAFLIMQRDMQSYSSHQPMAVQVARGENGSFQVTFVLHFEGAIGTQPPMFLSNFTRWTLVPSDNGLKLAGYTLDLL